MRVICQGCHTAYELPEGQEGVVGCPYCEHVNRPEGSAKPAAAPPPPKPRAGGFDANGTMVAPLVGDFGEETTQARAAVAGKPLGLPANQSFHLLVVDGDRPGERFSISKPEVTIGRKGADILLSDPESSRRHCALSVYGDAVLLQDLDSANGTLVNDRVVKACLLKNGDLLQIGGTILKLTVEPRP